MSPSRTPVRRYLDWPGPIPFAHRGGAGDQPENTMAAFAAAVGLGYHHLETDVHVTRDGVLMAFHDDALDRITDRGGRIAALNAAEVEVADAGHRFTRDGGRTFPFRGRGHRVPRLAALLDAWPHVRVNIDPKSDAAIEPLAHLIRRMDVYDRVCIGSFSDLRLRRFRRLVEDRVCTSMGPRAFAVVRLASLAGRAPRLGADCLQIPVHQPLPVYPHRVRLVDGAVVHAAHRAGMPVHVWTVDDPVEMVRLLDLGVDGLMSDRPAVLREVLHRRGQWHGGTGTTAHGDALPDAPEAAAPP